VLPIKHCEEIKLSEHFCAILALARIVNSIRFVLRAAIDSKDRDTPEASRQRINSFLYLGALLYEGIQAVKGEINKVLRHYSSFRQNFVPLFRDKEIESLCSFVLGPLRKKIVFHFDMNTISETLKNVDLRELTFAKSHSQGAGDVVYILADVIVVNYLLNLTSNQDSKKIEDLIEKVVSFSEKFCNAADEVISEVLNDFGVKIEFC